MAIRSHKYSSQGFTLLEMLAVLIVVGIVTGFAVPSLLSLNKPLRDGTLLFKNQIGLIRSKAISSNQAYRLRPKFNTRAEYSGSIPHNFVVEYASNCKVPENNVAPVATRWQAASQFDLDLPENIGITDIATTTISDPATIIVSNSLGSGVCFDNRGIVDTPLRLILKDFRGDNKAKIVLIDIGKLGSVDIYTYSNASATPTIIPPDSNSNPVF